MNLPETLSNAQSWTVIGPMGPKLAPELEALPILAVDGGAAFCSRIDVWTGDHDSLRTPLICDYKLSLNSQKDHSDLASAFNILAQTSSKVFHLWGFLGGRLDHELFNLGEAMRFLNKRPDNKLFFYNHQEKVSLQLFAAGTQELHIEGVFSLGTISPVQVSLTGNCKYKIPVLTEIDSLSSFGLSNFGQGKIRLENTSPVFIVFPEVP
jgi:thiamine pyrophosphokinase